jgi:hypothetical protein
MAMTKSLSIRLYELLKSEFPNSSPNLAKFARGKKYTDLKNYYRMYRSESGDLHLGFIDDKNCFCGKKLIRLACGEFQTFAYSILNPVDVTEWFISEYSQKGMCTYTDMRHDWIEDVDNAAPDGTTRTCRFCGTTETLRSKMVRKTWWE